MIRASNIRLPGVYFLPSRRPPGLGLPRLDVAAFVGFAERGPLDWPVAVEDLNTYRAIFGGDLALAREQGGRTVYANLPSAVASFFAQGGRRCYVVRVAGRGSTRTLLRLGGLVRIAGAQQAGSSDPPPALATLRASSEGRWSMALRLGARLRATPLPVAAFTVLAPEVAGTNITQKLSWKTGSAPDAIQKGDLLRLTYNGDRQYLFPVEEVRRPAASTPSAPFELLTQNTWQLLSPPTMSLVVRVDRLTPQGIERLYITGKLSASGGASPAKSFIFKMSGPDAGRVASGDVLRVKRIDNITLLLAVAEVGVSKEAGAAEQPFALALQALILPAQAIPPVGSSTLLAVERLRFDLLLREGKDRRPTIEELSFNEGHPRFWGDAVLVESSSLHRPVEGGESGASSSRSATPRGSQSSLAAESAELFNAIRGNARIETTRLARLDPAALAGLLSPVEDEGLTFLPLGMSAVRDEQEIVGPLEAEAGDDDLGSLDTGLFVDPALVPSLTVQPPTGDALMAQAFDRYYIQDKRLRGLHSLLFINEVALVSLPEAVLREWPGEPESPPVLQPPDITSPPEPPDLSKFCACPPPIVSPPAEQKVVSPPVPQQSAAQLPFLKKLDANNESDPQYLVELRRLVEMHHALLNFCQARRDAFAVLALPAYFEKRHCIRWQEDFRAHLGLPRRRSILTDARDLADLSYAGVYHPWLLLGDASASDRLRAVPPDGAACGMIAARERERQVWVAPANLPLGGVLGLSPEISTSDWADLFELQFNLVRREPRDFRAMSAHTLSDESIWLQTSVRRLLILIRKFVVARGMDMVFESNSERFRRGVQLLLEDAMLFMHGLGAFAGATPEQSFNVVTDASVNPPQGVEAGHFVAQIQVAPSQPTEFITVLLTRVDEDLLQAREG
ncbi:MAG: hypothetical protein QOE46_2751 [Acidobacteriota bacterium]|nr:hypothetical protein [Acidobacteriota bacterium]